MAKAARGAKTQAILDYLKSNPAAKASEIVVALAENGIRVSAPMIYTLKARRSMGKRRRRARSAGDSIEISITDLLAAKKLVVEVGGIDQARAAIDALARLI